MADVMVGTLASDQFARHHHPLHISQPLSSPWSNQTSWMKSLHFLFLLLPPTPIPQSSYRIYFEYPYTNKNQLNLLSYPGSNQTSSVIKTNTSPLANASFFQIRRVRVEIWSPIRRVNNSPPLNIKIPTPNPLILKIKKEKLRTKCSHVVVLFTSPPFATGFAWPGLVSSKIH